MSKSGSSITYGYNADGKRISKTVNGTTYNYAYLGDALTDLSWGSNRMHFTYDSLGPASVTYNGNRYFYLKNAQGDVTGLVKSCERQRHPGGVLHLRSLGRAHVHRRHYGRHAGCCESPALP